MKIERTPSYVRLFFWRFYLTYVFRRERTEPDIDGEVRRLMRESKWEAEKKYAELRNQCLEADVAHAEGAKNLQTLLGYAYENNRAAYAARDKMQAERDAAVTALRLIVESHDRQCAGEECQISGIDLAREVLQRPH